MITSKPLETYATPLATNSRMSSGVRRRTGGTGMSMLSSSMFEPSPNAIECSRLLPVMTNSVSPLWAMSVIGPACVGRLISSTVSPVTGSSNASDLPATATKPSTNSTCVTEPNSVMVCSSTGSSGSETSTKCSPAPPAATKAT